MTGLGLAPKVSAGRTAPGEGADAPPVILFGAFDRHNFGDLLFPHIAAALLPGREVITAGLADRDLTAFGGHRVVALRTLAQSLGLDNQTVDILHVGGELLTCTDWQAAVMLATPEAAQALIPRHAQDAAARQAWIHDQLGLHDQAPYVVGRSLFPQARRIAFTAVGGVDFADLAPPMRAEVRAKLAEADALSVRDQRTQACLAAEGIAADLVPDPAAMVMTLFGDRLSMPRHGEVKQAYSPFPGGFIAVQFSADFGDDATLGCLATQLNQVTTETGLGIVLFRAGAAPWHDDLAVYQRLMARLRPGTAALFTALGLWEIGALIAASRGFCGSSLHGRIVAMACGLPRVNLIHAADAGHSTKQAAYAATWETTGMPHAVTVDELADALRTALGQPGQRLQALAEDLAQRYRAGFSALWAQHPCHAG